MTPPRVASVATPRRLFVASLLAFLASWAVLIGSSTLGSLPGPWFALSVAAHVLQMAAIVLALSGAIRLASTR